MGLGQLIMIGTRNTYRVTLPALQFVTVTRHLFTTMTSEDKVPDEVVQPEPEDEGEESDEYELEDEHGDEEGGYEDEVEDDENDESEGEGEGEQVRIRALLAIQNV